jgi:hypothetical protein
MPPNEPSLGDADLGKPAPKYRPAWWQWLIMVGLLAIVGYRIGQKSHFVAVEGTITEVKTSTSRNRTSDDCVVNYRYSVQIENQAGKTITIRRERGVNSRTCRTDEIKPGDRETLYYNPQNPSETIDSPVDNLSLGLIVFSVIGAFTLLYHWWSK